jgi:signal transduction histidine kinase
VALELMPDNGQKARLAADVAEMERMIAGLLELERLRAGKGVVLVKQDVVPIVREVVSSYEDRPPGVQLVLDGVSDLVIAADAEQLRTVIRNLLENAVKYSLPDSRSIRVTISRNGGGVVGVSDDGAGIPSEDAERIFEPFFRVDRSRSKESGGYGLGLSICKRVMEAHGGAIALERKNERGATLVLRFPQPN